MLEGYILITKWYAQQMAARLQKQMRRFDRELNQAILEQLVHRVDDLNTAYSTGIGVTEAAAEVGICAMAIAHNVDRKVGEVPYTAPVQAAPVKTEEIVDADPFGELDEEIYGKGGTPPPALKALSVSEKVAASLKLPARKRGRKRKIK